MKTFRRFILVLLACGLPWLATEARAGCSTIITMNPTGHWVWITIYDLGKLQHLDYGWVGPHSLRAWRSGNYACGSFYHVRYEVKNGSSPGQPSSDPGNLFDTNIQINPQLTLADTLGLLKSIGDAITCVVPGAEAGCIEEWGIGEVAGGGISGVIGSDSNNSVVCIKPNGDGFYLENSGNCALRPGPLKPRPAPVDHYTFQPASRNIGIGTNTRNWYFNIAKNGAAIQDNKIYGSGRFWTDNPGIATFPDPHNGHLKGIKKGKTTAHWDYGNKHQCSAVVVVN
ncbi:MAG TPA: hypothetical protein VGI57_08250 [Usitatibacter sp.]